MRKNRKYTPEFKIKCVKEVLDNHKSQEKISKEFGMNTWNIRSRKR